MKYYLCNVVLAHKLGRAVVAGVLGFSLICGGIIGCGKGDDSVTPTETEAKTEVVETTVQVISDYDGDTIYFKQGGTIYEGRVVRVSPLTKS